MIHYVPIEEAPVIGEGLFFLRSKWFRRRGYRRADRVGGDRVKYVEIDTEDRRSLEEWGVADGIFVERRPVRTGPSPTYAALQEILASSLRREERRASRSRS